MEIARRRTMLVGSQTAWHHHQFELAKQKVSGAQVITVQGLVERLAGGFLRSLGRDELLLAATDALQAEANNLEDIKEIADLPGMAKALCATLAAVWAYDLDLSKTTKHKRCADLYRLEQAIISRFAPGTLVPAKLITEATNRLNAANPLLGSVAVKGVYGLKPCWRPLIAALAERISVTWEAFGDLDGWLTGTRVQVSSLAPNAPTARTAITCTSPSHEVLEALRWARELVASGRAKPHEISITAASVDAFDDYMRALRAECDLPLHFAEEQSALSSYFGQQTAALADLVLRGISQDRVLRAARFLVRENVELKALPDGWHRMLNPSAPLLRVEHWESEIARIKKEKDADLSLLLVFVRDVVRPISEAKELGNRWLRGKAKQIWQRALAEGPPASLATNLERIRIPDDTDPAASILWGSAGVSCTVPRPFVCLVGLNSRWWPRTIQEDALLPTHILGYRLSEHSIPELDRLHFKVLMAQATEIRFSRSRRDKEGRVLGTSPLFPKDLPIENLSPSRIPQHAFSQNDRLLARPREFAECELARSVSLCSRNHRSANITPHDGLVRPEHPVIVAALQRTHSATSLRSLLRNPLGFVWKYALHWREPENLEGEEPLFLNVLDQGSFVHEILEYAVRQLDAEGGLFQCSSERISTVIESVCEEISVKWEAERPVPPPAIWNSTKSEACALALSALTYDHVRKEDLTSFVEVVFGDSKIVPATDHPWNINSPVELPKTGLKVNGRIDRLDLNRDRTFARVTDYKVTRRTPTDDPGLDKGKELQRAIYAFVVQALLPEVKEIEAMLLYPRDGRSFPMQNLPKVTDDLIHYIRAAVRLTKQGYALPGIGMEDEYEELRFALPANVDAIYLRRKRNGRDEQLKELVPLWE